MPPIRPKISQSLQTDWQHTIRSNLAVVAGVGSASRRMVEHNTSGCCLLGRWERQIAKLSPCLYHVCPYVGRFVCIKQRDWLMSWFNGSSVLMRLTLALLQSAVGSQRCCPLSFRAQWPYSAAVHCPSERCWLTALLSTVLQRAVGSERCCPLSCRALLADSAAVHCPADGAELTPNSRYIVTRLYDVTP
jgi:hypothetical protein